MTLIPHKNETLVLPISADLAMSRLDIATQPAQLTQSKVRNDIIFNGSVESDSFRVSKKVNYPQNYLPIITGRVETSSRGCIIFIRYNLFFSSFMFLSFWTVMTMLIGFFLILYPMEYGYAIVAFASGLANYVVTILNFNKQIKISRLALNRVLKITR